MASSNTLELTDSDFEQSVINATTPALVDFWAEWCMPCKMMAPAIDELADEYTGKLVVGKVNTDENRNISMQFGISAIPTVILFKDGEMIKKFVGLQQKADLKTAIDEALA